MWPIPTIHPWFVATAVTACILATSSVSVMATDILPPMGYSCGAGEQQLKFKKASGDTQDTLAGIEIYGEVHHVEPFKPLGQRGFQHTGGRVSVK